ncbi:hypothetical protein [Tabrizicola sp.]|uniref:hypothetical protein n=1 Tax=Tabrizicola sp. TaxID=2005166 RepID=UPI00286CEAC0|nr:hypothetical protein [Tabrizicola sp.]
MKPVLAFLILSACASVVPGTVARLATLDPLTADPAAIEVAVILPPGLAVVPGSAKLEFGATRGAESRKGSFTLRDIAATPDVAAPKGSSARVFALTTTDAAQMRALQAEISAWKREGKAQGSLGLGIGGCATGAGPAADATGSVLIRLDKDAPFLPLIREGRLADILGADVLAAIQPCKGPN